MARKHKEKKKSSIINGVKQLFSKPENRWKDIPSNIKNTDEYVAWRNLTIKKEDNSFFRNISIGVFSVSFLWCLIGELFKRSSKSFHIACGIIAVITFITSGLLIWYSWYLSNSKKSQAINEAWDNIKNGGKNE